MKPYCPYCYNGTIVYLKKHKIFVCNACKKQVEMEIIDETQRTHIHYHRHRGAA